MPILSQDAIEEEEELIRNAINQLSDNERKIYFHTIKSKIKDPDTYAVLNWFFIAGLHHFYLENWVQGCIHLTLFLIGIVLIIIGLVWTGVVIILGISVAELYSLFQSQLIVQNYNNQIMKKAIKEISKSQK